MSFNTILACFIIYIVCLHARSSNEPGADDGGQLYCDEAQFNLDTVENHSYDCDEPADFDSHGENTVGGKWDDESHEASSIVDESGWEELDTKSSDEATMSDMKHPVGTSQPNNNLPGSLLSAENPPGASADNNASVNTDAPVFGSEPLAADVDDTAPWASCVSLRRRKAPSDVYEEPFCSDCELVIHADHLLKCSEPSCTEKVCLICYVVLEAT